MVTTRTPGAQQLIDDFRGGKDKWIVAVGMISEGTDIPRLQVCCYLSRIRTELHYRQVLGRVLRRTGNKDNEAWLYVLAEPSLLQFSLRVAEDLPDDLGVLDYAQLLRLDDAGSTLHEDSMEQQVSGPLNIQLLKASAASEEVAQGVLSEESLFSMELSSGFRTEILSAY